MTRQLEHFPNLVAMFLARTAEKGDAPFLWQKIDDRWRPISWRDAARIVASLAAGLKAVGVAPGDRVMLVSENRPEWCLSDLAIMAAGAITVPTYVTNTERDHAHIVTDSAARAVIVSTARLAKTVLPALVRAAEPRVVIGMEPLPHRQAGDLDLRDWRQLIADHPAGPETIDLPAGRADPACIIYTSGTGGAPRGVVQHHGAILHNVAGCSAIIAEDFGWGDEVFLSFLPLSHAYEHTGGQYLPIGLGGQIYYAEGLDKLAANIAEVRPTIMVVVPRLFELLRTRITKAVGNRGRLQAYLLDRAIMLGAKAAAGERNWRDRPLQFIVDRLLKPKVAARFGGRIKAMVSGGSPLNPDVGLFFHSLGLTLMQGYGQTEAGPVISCNRPRAGITMDTVGPPLGNTEVRIADDGEILVRGELVMHGYWRNTEETARALVDGWLHTGDIGEFDTAGRLRITDRKKDIIVNDKGENVAPQKVEGMLTLQPEIAQAMIYGDRRPHLTAVIVPDDEWTQQFCAAGGVPCSFTNLATNSSYRMALGAAMERVNRDLAPAERVRRFILADTPFAIDNEQLTPSLKIRRHVLQQAYGDRLDALYKS